MTIAREFRWEMAHRLPWHDGGCRNVHGHSYMMRVELEGERDARGILIDYLEVKSLVEPLIEELDHGFLAGESDTLMLDFLKANAFKHYVVPFDSTAENLAVWMCERLRATFASRQNLSRLSIRLSESARTYAEASIDLRA
jgi:6-pyruvoyltetrahydropterin/6-carboxytetrahydropterin synthase